MDRSSARRAVLFGTAMLGVGIRPASAQAGRLRIICLGPPGSTPDAIARIYADALAAQVPGGVVVENRPGASGFIGVAALRQSAADGGTLLLGHAGLVTSYPHIFAKLPYDPARDLAPVALAAETAFAIALGPRVPAEVVSLDAFVAWAKANPREVNCGTPGGIGASPHLIAADFFRVARAEAQFVPYQTPTALLGDLLGSRLALAVLPEGIVRPLHESARLRTVAITGKAPSRFLPSVPTLAASGLSTVPGTEWFGFFAPAGTVPRIVSELVRKIREASQVAALTGAFDASALSGASSTPEEMSARIAAERESWKPLAAALGLRLE